MRDYRPTKSCPPDWNWNFQILEFAEQRANEIPMSPAHDQALTPLAPKVEGKNRVLLDQV